MNLLMKARELFNARADMAGIKVVPDNSAGGGEYVFLSGSELSAFPMDGADSSQRPGRVAVVRSEAITFAGRIEYTDDILARYQAMTDAIEAVVFEALLADAYIDAYHIEQKTTNFADGEDADKFIIFELTYRTRAAAKALRRVV